MALGLAHPCDAFAVELAVLCMVYFAYRVCAPRTGGNGAPSQTQANLTVLGYAAGAFLQLGESVKPVAAGATS